MNPSQQKTFADLVARTSDDISEYATKLPENMREKFAAAKAKRDEEMLQNVVEEMVTLFQQADQIQNKRVEKLRQLRQQVKQALAELKHTSEAIKYASETSNVFPLLESIGVPVDKKLKHLTKLPTVSQD
jgi:recombinational DNA repair ATPase RecF